MSLHYKFPFSSDNNLMLKYCTHNIILMSQDKFYCTMKLVLSCIVQIVKLYCNFLKVLSFKVELDHAWFSGYYPEEISAHLSS
jgi:hypothetical protein